VVLVPPRRPVSTAGNHRDRRLSACASHRRVARVERVACRVGVVCLLEQVRVDLERDLRVGVPELAGGEDDVQALGDQERGEAVPKGLEREPSGPAVQPRPPKRRPEALADVAVVPARGRVCYKNTTAPALEWGGEPPPAQEVTTDGDCGYVGCEKAPLPFTRPSRERSSDRRLLDEDRRGSGCHCTATAVGNLRPARSRPRNEEAVHGHGHGVILAVAGCLLEVAAG
jgi:hypothetical protein